MRDEFTWELKNAFIEEIEKQNMACRVQNNVVVVAFEPSAHIGINHPVMLAVSFLRKDIMVTILDIATAKNRERMLALLNEKNRSNIFGKYCLSEKKEVEYKSLKWFPRSTDDPECVFELMMRCLKEFADSHDDIVYSVWTV